MGFWDYVSKHVRNYGGKEWVGVLRDQNATVSN